MIRVRRFTDIDAPTSWALSDLPNIGATADSTVPLPLPPATSPPVDFPDLADITGRFVRSGGAFLVAELNGHLVGMGRFGPSGQQRAEVLRVRVHRPGWAWTLVYYAKKL
ncbi:hypothetical protein [Actinoplanes sp. M2I2]|uniref:hypothetical protein n=1 Tax=Actinoplanes sp. M2I2 TaxID=1734444 RepID=UPI002020104C|nr:hypothetical protein [Actinoplanes sp. M2I2]